MLGNAMLLSGGLYPLPVAAFPVGTCSSADHESSANLNQGCMQLVQRQQRERTTSRQAKFVDTSYTNLQLFHDHITQLVLGQ